MILRRLLTAFLLLVLGSATGYVARGMLPEQGPLEVQSTHAVAERLDCITEGHIARIKADFEFSRELFAQCRPELASKLASLDLDEEALQVAFASLLANTMAPYGSSRSIELADLLKDETLDCDNYAILTGHIARLFGSHKLAFAGFDGGAVGNHAQLFFENAAGRGLLVDPTIGLVASTSFNDLLQGKPVPNHLLKLFRQHRDGKLDPFAQRVGKAVLSGSYRPSDLLYYMDSLDSYIAFSNDIAPLWEKSRQEQLLMRFPTPGSNALRANLERS